MQRRTFIQLLGMAPLGAVPVAAAVQEDSIRVPLSHFKFGYRRLLPKSQWRSTYCLANEALPFDRVLIGCYVTGPGNSLSYEHFAVRDLPNVFMSLEELDALKAANASG